MSQFKVLVTDHNVRPEGLDILRDSGAEVDVLQAFTAQDILIGAAGDVDGILARAANITRDVVTASPRLKVVSRHGVGYENVDIGTCSELGVAVTISGDANSQAVSEQAFALLMASARQLMTGDRIARDGSWDRDGVVGVEFHRKTLGIIGLGRIGSRLARQAHGFEMEVLVYDPYATAEAAAACDTRPVRLTKLLAESDFISLHVPLTEETRHLIGKDELTLMKPTAILTNTARGGLIDERALYDALKSGQIAGAALDVFEQEPLPPDHFLTELDNLVCSPHVAARRRSPSSERRSLQPRMCCAFFAARFLMFLSTRMS